MELFKPLSSEEKQNFLKKMNFFNHVENNALAQKANSKGEKTIVLISSTSWTKDEDFGILFKSLELYEESAKNEGMMYYFPKIILYITGKS